MVRSLFAFAMLIASLPFMGQTDFTRLLNDSRTFEVTACKPSKNSIIVVWVERRPERKDNQNDNAEDICIAYKYSSNNGKTWTDKTIIDLPNTFNTVNPYITHNGKGEVYLVTMHVGKNFFSGNISLYEFDFKTKQFNLKSIPVGSPDRMLDIPSLVCLENELHMVYVAYEKGLKNRVRYQMSKDKGRTWTSPIDVFKDTTIKYLGASIDITKEKKVVISAGSYDRNNIYFVKRKANTNNIEFEDPIIVSQVSSKLNAAKTELSMYDQKLLVSWQYPHEINETYLSYSLNEGAAWTEPFFVTARGNLLSAVFDKEDNLHCIYSDYTDKRFSVKYKMLNQRYEVLKESNLLPPTPLDKMEEYIGAFQKLLIQGDELYAFWIDYPNNNTLKFTKWKF